MTRWVALLRGVNVGGVKATNTELTEVFLGLGFERVKPVLASGNIVLDSDGAPLASQVENALAARYSRTMPVILVSQEELSDIVGAYPFSRDDATTHPYVMFAADRGALKRLAAAADAAGGGADVSESAAVLYWRCPKGDTLTNPVAKAFETVKDAGVVTNRNLRTLEKLAEA